MGIGRPCRPAVVAPALTLALTPVSVLVLVPGLAAAQPLDPGTVADASGPVRAAASFVLVLAFGGVVLSRYGAFVDRSVDAVLDRPTVAVVYGLMAYLAVAMLGFYAVTQLSRVGGAGTALGTLGFAVLGAAIMLLTGFGFLVVGTLLTDLYGRRRPQYGLVVGAALSAVGWVVLPRGGALVVWIALAAFGIGGSTRVWFHSERAVESERNP